MKQIEVRLAVVLYGGVSLAVYIHGVTREILNLVRASKLFRAAAKSAPSQGDSTAIYYELLSKFSPELDLRVVVDLISGASAGGINGVLLGKALAHDLPLEPHRELWLKNADVTSLSNPGSPLGRLTKAAMAPLFDQLLIRRFGQQVADPETRAKLRQFIQAQWSRRLSRASGSAAGCSMPATQWSSRRSRTARCCRPAIAWTCS
jgi:patatin-related protein